MDKKTNKNRTNISKYKLLLDSHIALGGTMTHSNKRGDRLNSYAGQRNFYSIKKINDDSPKKIDSLLLSLFRGDQYFMLEKKDSIKNTDQLFDTLFDIADEIIFLSQREHDIAIFKQTKFSYWENIVLFLIVISHITSRNRDKYTKTCPLIYVNRILLAFRDNKFRPISTIEEVVHHPLELLKKNKDRTEISLYHYLNTFNYKNPPSPLTISTKISTLRNELKDKLSEEQEELVQEISGLLNCFAFLFRIHRLYPLPSKNKLKINLEISAKYATAYEAVSIASEYYFQGIDFLLLTNPETAFRVFALMKPSSSFFSQTDVDRIMKKYLLYYQSISGIKCTVIPWLKKDQELNLFLNELQDISNLKIDLVTKKIRNKLNIKNLSEFFEYLKNNDKDRALESITILANDIDSEPYIFKNLISLFYVGLSLSSNERLTPNELDKYILIYTETLRPHSTLSVSLSEPTNLPLDERKNRFLNKNLYDENCHNLQYDKNITLVKMIETYHRFLTRNDIGYHFYANILKKANTFFEEFFSNYDNNQTITNETKRISSSLNKLKSTFNEAQTIPFINLDILNLHDRYLLERLWLIGLDDLDLGLTSIDRFCKLPFEKRDAIMIECEKLRIPKKS